MRPTLYRKVLKRTFDLVITIPVLILISPLLGVIAIAVWLKMGSPVLFRQQRPGLKGRPFVIYKFRTMTDERDEQGQLADDTSRLTRLGRWLRTYSLDELPQFWNVVRGDLSLVGPRPLLIRYLDRFTPEQFRRHDVKPGLSGWAQVNGRNAIDWERKFELDLWYVDHCSLWLDLKILFLTVIQVIRRDGINAKSHVTMVEFGGSALSEDWITSQECASRQVDIIGAGGHAKVVMSTLRAAGWNVKNVYDDDSRLWGRTILGRPIRGPVSQLRGRTKTSAVIAIGDPHIRRQMAEELSLDWISVVHPAAHVDSSVKLQIGTVVFAGAVVQPDTSIGRHVVINTGATVDHDNLIGDFSNIGPGAHLAGNVHIGSCATLGIGCSMIPGITIGEDTIVGAGAVVIKDLPNGVVAAGVPARIIKTERTYKRAS